MGTSGVVFAHAAELGFDPKGRLQRGCHAVPGAWHVMGVVLAAGGSFQWFRNELGKAEVALARDQGIDPYFLLTGEAALAGVGAEGLFFLPYMTGERTPHFDPHAKGAWIGLTVRHGRAHMIRSLLEGATYAMRDSLELIREMGVTIEQIRVSGGGARNPLWRQIQADIYGHDVHTLNSTEGPAFGVALLAMVGAGAFASVPEACDATIRLAEQMHRRSPGAVVLRPGLRALPQALPGPPRVVRRDQYAGGRVSSIEEPHVAPTSRTVPRGRPPESAGYALRRHAGDGAGPPWPHRLRFWTRTRLALAVGLLLAIHLVLAVQSLVQENPTIDEVIHLPAGITLLAAAARSGSTTTTRRS